MLTHVAWVAEKHAQLSAVSVSYGFPGGQGQRGRGREGCHDPIAKAIATSVLCSMNVKVTPLNVDAVAPVSELAGGGQNPDRALDHPQDRLL